LNNEKVVINNVQPRLKKSRHDMFHTTEINNLPFPYRFVSVRPTANPFLDT